MNLSNYDAHFVFSTFRDILLKKWTLLVKGGHKKKSGWSSLNYIYLFIECILSLDYEENDVCTYIVLNTAKQYIFLYRENNLISESKGQGSFPVRFI